MVRLAIITAIGLLLIGDSLPAQQLKPVVFGTQGNRAFAGVLMGEPREVAIDALSMGAAIMFGEQHVPVQKREP